MRSPRRVASAGGSSPRRYRGAGRGSAGVARPPSPAAGGARSTRGTPAGAGRPFPGAGVVDIEVAGHHVEVAGQHHRMATLHQLGGVADEVLEPGQLVVELRSRLGIAIGQVKTGHQQRRRPLRGSGCGDRWRCPAGRGVPPAAGCRGRGWRRRSTPTGPARSRRIRPSPAPRREARVGRLQFLQADDVRRFPLQPGQQRGQPGLDAVDVEGGDLQGVHRLSPRMTIRRPPAGLRRWLR